MHIYQVLKRPIQTEKSNYQAEEFTRYTFEVDGRANKHMVRSAVEGIFNVHVLDVNVMTVHGKKRRFGRHETQLADWKKAVVTLMPGETIQVFEGV